MRTSLIAALALLAGATEAVSAAPLQFGIADTRTGPLACVTFQGPALQAGQAVYVMRLDPPGWTSARIAAKRATPCDPSLEGRAYAVRLPPHAGMQQFVGIAVVANGIRPAHPESHLLLIDGQAGAPVSLHSCSSHEGRHFAARQAGKRVWQAYLSLGYDTESTCSHTAHPATAP